MLKYCVIRINVTKKFGSGHLYRALHLSESLKKYYRTVLVIKADKLIDNYKSLIKNIECYFVSTKAEEFEIYRKLSRVGLIILDKKNNSSRYISDLKKFKIPVVSIDDLGTGREKCDILIDANIHIENVERNKFFGEKYILLPEIYSKYGKKKKIITKDIKKILMFFGGSDPAGIAEFVISKVSELNFKNCDISLITNFNAETDNIKIFKPVLSAEEMADLYFKSDIAVISGGISVYESMCTGTPAIVMNQHQEQFDNVVYYNNCILNAGIFNKKDAVKKLNESFDKIKNQNLREQFSFAAKKTVDGLGNKRIINILKKFR